MTTFHLVCLYYRGITKVQLTVTAFQEQEKDDEVKGAANSLNYKFRMHDPRVGRFLSLDRSTIKKYPWNSSFAFSKNRVIKTVARKKSLSFHKKKQLYN